jgi:hypothetical protein
MIIGIYKLNNSEWRVWHINEKSKFREHITIDSKEIIELTKMLKEREF